MLLFVMFLYISVLMVVRKVVSVLFELVGVVIRVGLFVWIVGYVCVCVVVGVLKWL